ncbi:MAG: ankyrin repeat domain-containing protein [Rhizobiaceae bacterium]|nr:ankyrin repeat domain-containing protein [Rhizobiaceae bacterium]
MLTLAVTTLATGGCSAEQSTEAEGTRNLAQNTEGTALEKGPDGQPIIFWKITEEDRAAVNELLDQGYDIETPGGFGMTPVIQAAMIDDWITVELLLQRGADPMVADRRGFTVPYLASTSRVAPEGTYGQALDRVRALLNERGIGGTVYKPDEVKRMLAAGQWPPQ